MTAPGTYYVDEWQELRATIAQQSRDALGGFIAGYFPRQYGASRRRILYVTSSLPGYVPAVFGIGSHPFEKDANALALVTALGNLANGGTPDPLAYVPITPFCKVGLQSGEVTPALLLVQQQLAVQTLRYELYGYNPHLVVFACGGKFSAAIRETVNAHRGSLSDLQKEGEGNEAYAFRPRGDSGEPAVLVLQTPSVLPLTAQKPWLDKAAALLR